MEAIPGNACPLGRAEPSPKGRREAARRGPPQRTGVVKDRTHDYAAVLSTCRRRSSVNASLGVRQLRHRSGRSLSM